MLGVGCKALVAARASDDPQGARRRSRSVDVGWDVPFDSISVGLALGRVGSIAVPKLLFLLRRGVGSAEGGDKGSVRARESE